MTMLHRFSRSLGSKLTYSRCLWTASSRNGRFVVMGQQPQQPQHYFSTASAESEPAAQTDDAPTAADIAKLQQLFQKNEKAAKMTFSSTSKLTTGLRSKAAIRNGKFEIHADEPVGIGGTDTAPNPVEILLAALGSCQEITYKAYAQALQIPLDSVSLQLDGDIDLRGFFAVDPQIRPGFQKITGVVTVETPESVSTEQVEQLKGVVDQHCPVLDMLGAVPTNLTLNHVQK